MAWQEPHCRRQRCAPRLKTKAEAARKKGERPKIVADADHRHGAFPAGGAAACAHLFNEVRSGAAACALLFNEARSGAAARAVLFEEARPPALFFNEAWSEVARRPGGPLMRTEYIHYADLFS